MRLLSIIFLFLTVGCAAQTRISSSQIQDGAVTSDKIATGAVTSEKLSSTALRPSNSGVLSNFELVFDQVYEKYTLTVDEDIALTLAGSGNVEDSRIVIYATGDGSHALTWPTNWTLLSGTYDPNQLNRVFLEYTQSRVFVTIESLGGIDAIETALTSATITRESPTELVLVFNEPVTFSSMGWSVSASAAGVTIGQVSGSGTANIVLTLSRAILHTETVTISYGTDNGETVDLAGFELAAITNFNVTEPEAPDPVTQDCDITVCASGCDYTTITAANAAASPSDVICIGAGTYRETVTVADNDVTFTNITGEEAIISGFEVVGTSGWTVHSGNIYRKTITLPVNGFNTSTDNSNIYPTTIYANQVLRNGAMMPEARWPNLPATDGVVDFVNFMKWENYRQLEYDAGFGYTGLTDGTLPLSSGLTGATLISNGWFPTESRTVTQTGATTLTYPGIWGASGTNLWTRKAYYLTGKLGLLNTAGEWHYESGTLYFWQPGGGAPSGTIEYKARNWGFDIRGRSGVKIIGLTFIGVDPVIGDASSTNALIEKTTATFNNHYVRVDPGLWNGGIDCGMARIFGTKLLGAGSVFKDNVWSNITGAGVWLGPNCRAENNKMEYIGGGGDSAAPFSFWGSDGSQVVTRNTIHYTGRSAIDFGYVNDGQHTNIEISYNDMGYYGMISGDLGATYAAGEVNLSGLNYHHNHIHDAESRDDGEGGLTAHIYFDQATGPGTIHHNVTWGPANSDMYHETENGIRSGAYPSAVMNVYNNTFASTDMGNAANCAYRTYVTSPLDVQRNNIYRRPMVVGWPAAGIKGNTLTSLPYTTDPLFVGSGTEGLAYRIQSGSSAVNAGTTIAGITDGSVGVPDIGAYEYGGEEWVPGYTEPVDDGSVNNTDFTYSLNWTHYTNFKTGFKDNDVHVTTTLNSTAEYSFHGTQVEVVMEKCNNSATARFEVLDEEDEVVDTEDVDLYVVDPGGSTEVCPTGANSIETVFTSDVLAEGDYTIRITLQTQNTGATPSRNALVFDSATITP